MKTETFSVPGVSCDHCIRAITDEVGTVDGVVRVHVDLDSKMVTVEVAENVSREELAGAIQEAGYDSTPFTRSIPLN